LDAYSQVYDEKEGWFLVGSVHPYYTEGLSLFIHLRIRKRLRQQHAGGPFDMEKYLANKAELLREFFEIAGEADALTAGSPRRRELQLGTRMLGRALDFTLAETRRFAPDVKENRAAFHDRLRHDKRRPQTIDIVEREPLPPSVLDELHEALQM
jgi:hypothetical protein